ncbi:hypothetical protein C2G38_2156399 [Gigaspora rosea]|uniref:Uncharacterized protein n=1 Tax=Gigaspora rosea TaxID=44941 RepID=A0A397W4T5_9GLOM|nr:hypothetical protein C2G38_2156399 [Gigaspora rosea]
MVAHYSAAYGSHAACNMISNMMIAPLQLLQVVPSPTPQVTVQSNGNSNWSYPPPVKNRQREVEHSLDVTRPTIVPKNKISSHENKNKTDGKKKVKFVDLSVVTELDDKPREKVFVEKLRPGSRKLESKENGVSGKKDTSNKNVITDSPKDPIDDVQFLFNRRYDYQDEDRIEKEKYKPSNTEDDGLRAVDVNDRVAVVKRSKNITIVFDQGKVAGPCVEEDEHQIFVAHQKSVKMDRVKGVNDLVNSYQNDTQIKKHESKVYVNYQKPPDMSHTNTTSDHERVIKIRVAPKEETNGIDVEERESTKNCENLKAACIRWKKKVELFKTQANAIKYNEKLGPIGESYKNNLEVDKAYRVWILKVENVKGVELEKEKKKQPILNVLPCKVEDKNSDTNKGHEENKIANEITIRSRIKKWINKCKTAKLLKFKEKKRKDLPNGSEEIKSWHVTFEFQIRKTSEDIGRQLPFIHNNLGEREKWIDIMKAYRKKKNKKNSTCILAHAEHMLRPKSSDLTRGLGKIHDQNFYDKGKKKKKQKF